MKLKTTHYRSRCVYLIIPRFKNEPERSVRPHIKYQSNKVLVTMVTTAFTPCFTVAKVWELLGENPHDFTRGSWSGALYNVVSWGSSIVGALTTTTIQHSFRIAALPIICCPAYWKIAGAPTKNEVQLWRTVRPIFSIWSAVSHERYKCRIVWMLPSLYHWMGPRPSSWKLQLTAAHPLRT